MSTDIERWDDEEEIEEVEPVERPEDLAARVVELAGEIATLSQEVAADATPPEQEPGTALVPTSGQTAAQAKQRLARMRADALKQQERLEQKKDVIRAKQDEMKEIMRRQMAFAEEVIGPLEKYVERLQEGIWMVNLYLGRDEEILNLYDGEPAAADEVIAIRQMVLAMDEECAIDPENDGIDATNIDLFDEWLQKDWSHVTQVAPEEKCVVALRPRFASKFYEDPWKRQSVDEANKQTYFLIRNGGKVYRTWTEFNVGEKLVPSADEFSDLFFETRTVWGKPGAPDHKIPITPGTPAWERAEESADARQRHFMRVGLILQGLVDRTTVLHPLPDGGVSFFDMKLSHTWRFVMDGDMSLTTGRKPFYEWLAERNEQLRVGMRIVGAFDGSAFHQHSYDHGSRNSRIYPPNARRPDSLALHTIEGKEGEQFVIRYERAEQVWRSGWIESADRPGWGHHGGYVDAKQRASCRIEPSDKFVLPFDLVTEEEMIGYLQSTH